MILSSIKVVFHEIITFNQFILNNNKNNNYDTTEAKTTTMYTYDNNNKL